MRSAVEPVRVVTALALTVPEVLESMVFRSAAAADPLSIVTLTLVAVSIVEALIAAAIFAALPVIVATEAALILTVVFVSSVFRSAATREVSESVTALSPRPVMPLEL